MYTNITINKPNSQQIYPYPNLNPYYPPYPPYYNDNQYVHSINVSLFPYDYYRNCGLNHTLTLTTNEPLPIPRHARNCCCCKCYSCNIF